LITIGWLDITTGVYFSVVRYAVMPREKAEEKPAKIIGLLEILAGLYILLKF